MGKLEERVISVNRILLKLRVLKSFVQTKFRKFKSRPDIELWQNRQFNKLKKSALTHSAYYSDYTHRPLNEWPIINKRIHLENFNQINTRNLELDEVLRIAEKSEVDREFSPKYNGVSVGLSSGTSGNRGVFVTSDKERAVWAGSILARLLPDFRPQKIAFFLRANNNLYETVKSRYIRFEFFDLMQPMDRHIKRLVKYNPTILIAPAQVLVVLARYWAAGMEIMPRKIISVAEVLTEDDKTLIEGVFKQRVHQIYQCTEGFLAHTCSEGELHLNEDTVLFEKEWINQRRGIFIPVVTDLKRQSQPVIRYRLDDVLVENFVPCPCGSPMTRLKKIMGRFDDVLFFKSVNESEKIQALFPDFICRVISGADRKIQRFKVMQKSADEILVELDDAGIACKAVVEKALVGMFERHKLKEPGIKFSAFEQSPLSVKCRRVVREWAFSDEYAQVCEEE
ncbi:MAG TPA: hypothetical protein ENJ08_20655 [Gammaproteobacteria bacterium]|nr:hypothetical protein [Gammaproteobacteria bacterium]